MSEVATVPASLSVSFTFVTFAFVVHSSLTFSFHFSYSFQGVQSYSSLSFLAKGVQSYSSFAFSFSFQGVQSYSSLSFTFLPHGTYVHWCWSVTFHNMTRLVVVQYHIPNSVKRIVSSRSVWGVATSMLPVCCPAGQLQFDARTCSSVVPIQCSLVQSIQSWIETQAP